MELATAMDASILSWWEREKLLTEKDKEAIKKAKDSRWEDIEEDWAETEAGRYEIHDIIMCKYHNEEFKCAIL